MTMTPDAPSWLISCLDCTASAEHLISHDDTCPTLRRVERVCAVDEAWFAAHPLASWRWRDLDPAERSEIAMAGYDTNDLYCRVLVVNDGGGTHRRVIACNGQVVVVVQDVPPVRGWAA